MATLNFPSSDQSPFVAPNGVTYVWNNDGYWEASGDSLNDVYLSSTVDDNAAGAITFEDTTTHEGGVEVAGSFTVGTPFNGGVITTSGGDAILLTKGAGGVGVRANGQMSLGNVTTVFGDAIVTMRDAVHESFTGDVYGIRFNKDSGTGLTGASNVYGYEARFNATKSLESFTGFIAQKGSWGAGVGATELKGFAVENGFANDAGTSYGFYSNISSSGDVANPFNFYAAGTAPNYFRGLTTHDGGVYVQDGILAINPNDSDDNGRAWLCQVVGDMPTTITDGRLFFSRPGYSGTGSLGSIVHFQAQPQNRPPAGLTIDAQIGYSAGSNLAGANVTKAYGFRSDLTAQGADGKTNYNFWSDSSAPSRLFGSLGIGVSEAVFNPSSFILHTEGNVRHIGINATGSTSPLYIASSGTLTTSSSDERLKTNINPLPTCIEKVKQLTPISFNWIDTEEYGERVHLGFTAQNVQRVVPEAVGQGLNDYLSLDPHQLIPILTKALQETLGEIDSLKERLAALEGA